MGLQGARSMSIGGFEVEAPLSAPKQLFTTPRSAETVKTVPKLVRF